MAINGFIKSFFPILKRLKKFKIELILISIAFFIAIISLILYLSDREIPPDENEVITGNVLSAASSRIVIDIAGAVEHPGVYESTSGARLKDVLIQAGGLSADAERDYIARNFNLAKLVTDQEKIYVPSHSEVATGIFAEPQRTIEYLQPLSGQQSTINNQQSNLININSATLEELDTLAGVGKITAEKIIKNRPYKSVEELVNKKIVKKNIYEKIKPLITIN